MSQVAASQASKISATKDDPKWSAAYGKLPLSFEENQGQTAREVRYVSHGSGYELFLTPQEAVLALRPNVPRDLSPLHRTATLRAPRKARRAGQVTAICMRLEGANPDAQIAGMDQLPGRTNYFIGNDPKKWHTDLPSYGRVKYAGSFQEWIWFSMATSGGWNMTSWWRREPIRRPSRSRCKARGKWVSIRRAT